MYEKVNPSHPDKVADRIAGSIVDYCYTKEENPRAAVEVLIGHGVCHIIAETSIHIPHVVVDDIVTRIAGPMLTTFDCVKQDEHLSRNQETGIRCGDNGIFRGMQSTFEQKMLSGFARHLYKRFPTDGKFIIDGGRIVICQSNASKEDLAEEAKDFSEVVINPLGEWTGGTNVDSGATNRKLGSDMGDAVTGGGLHGKDLSKADVSVNIRCHQLANQYGGWVEAVCAIGDKKIVFHVRNEERRKVVESYDIVVKRAREYIKNLGGFEKFAEWGIV